jgi:cyclin A
MAEQENCTRVTRAAKKRAAALASTEDQPLNKKRVVLGELPNLSNAIVHRTSPRSRKQKQSHRQGRELQRRRRVFSKRMLMGTLKIPKCVHHMHLIFMSIFIKWR